MSDLSAADPADLIIAWEAVEELLGNIPDSPAKDVLRLVAAGVTTDEIADRLSLEDAEVEALAARGRIRILTASIAPRRPTAPA